MARAIVWEWVAQSEEELEKEPQEQQAVAVEEEELKGEPADVVKDEDLELEKEPQEQQAAGHVHIICFAMLRKRLTTNVHNESMLQC